MGFVRAAVAGYAVNRLPLGVSAWRLLSQIVFMAKPLSDFPDLLPALGPNMRTISDHCDIPGSTNWPSDGHGINVATLRILAQRGHK